MSDLEREDAMFAAMYKAGLENCPLCGCPLTSGRHGYIGLKEGQIYCDVPILCHNPRPMGILSL